MSSVVDVIGSNGYGFSKFILINNDVLILHYNALMVPTVYLMYVLYNNNSGNHNPWSIRSVVLEIFLIETSNLIQIDLKQYLDFWEKKKRK